MPVDYINIIDRVLGHLKPGGIGECMAEDRRFLCSDRGIAARAGRRRELKRCMGTTGVNAKKSIQRLK